MDDESSLVAPPATLLLPLGPPMTRVAQLLGQRLPTVAEGPDDGTAPTRRGPLAALVLISAETPFEDVRELLSTLPDRALPRRTRLWIAVDANWGEPMLAELDAYLDEPTAPEVDAVVLLPAAESAAVAAAVEAWVWLRHDAPSGALADLRDDGGACRFAAIAAVAPSSPPRDSTAETRPPAAAGEHARLLLNGELDAWAETSRNQARERAESVVADTGQALTAAALAPMIPAASAEHIAAARNALGSQTLAGLQAAELFCREVAAESAGAADAPELQQAGVDLVGADTAVHVEESRTGIAARIGRRKRLAAATAQRSAAAARWVERYAEHVARSARAEFARDLGTSLAEAVRVEAAQQEEKAAAARQEASAAWLREATAAAAAIQPPAELDPAGLSRAWGRAAPLVRHHLLVPAVWLASAATEPPDGTPAVAVSAAPGLGSPLAAAILMGLPLRALRLRR
ncbi:MAG: hypothetical protein KDC23_07900 [Actinobacteria bacterium]|nr:hypothetical protein [Actinomycetota bacterium]